MTLYRKPTSFGEALGGLFIGAVIFVGIIAIAIGLALFKAYVFTYLWDWFIVTTFNAQPITYLQALGLAIVVTFYIASSSLSKYLINKDFSFWNWIGGDLIGILFTWLFGYIVHLYL